MSGLSQHQRRTFDARRRRAAKRQPLQVERLESRAMLAGDGFTVTLELDPDSDTGTPDDWTTNVLTPTFIGDVDDGATSVKLFFGANQSDQLLGNATLAAGRWTLFVEEGTFPEEGGTFQIVAQAFGEPEEGDEPAPLLGTSKGLVIEIDTTAPEAPQELTLGSDSNSGSKEDRITNIERPEFTGKAEANATVTVTLTPAVGDAIQLDPVVATDGSWTAKPSSDLPDGVWTLTAVAEDIAGNVSDPSAPVLLITIDTIAPAKPTVGLADGMDKGTDTADGKTNVKNPTFQGKAEDGATVTVTLTPQGGSPIELDPVEATDGSWTATPSSDLADGVWTVTAVATDIADNTSFRSDDLLITIVTTAKPQQPRLATGSDSSGGNNITRFVLPTFTGVAPNAEFVAVLRSKGNSVPEPLAKGVSVNPSTSVWTADVPDALVFYEDGTYNITVVATDAEGFVSAASEPLTIRIDTTRPDASAAPTLDDSTNSGSKDDTITKFERPKFTGQDAEPGSMIEVFSTKVGPDGGEPVSRGAASVADDGKWQLTVPADKQFSVDGKYAITVRATDAADNVSDPSESFEITIDTTPPDVSKATLSESSDSGEKGDGITNFKRPTLEGSADPGSKVTVTLTPVGGSSVDPLTFGPVTAGNNGSWSVTPIEDVPDGVWTVGVMAEDVAGNQGFAPGPDFRLTIRTTKPAKPSMPDLAAASDKGLIDDDDVTNVTTPTLTGKAPAGTTAAVFVARPGGGVSALGAGIPIDPVTLRWSLAVTDAFTPDGVYSITARATDAEGNVSDSSDPLEITIDTTRPRLTAFTRPNTPRKDPVDSITITFDEEVFGLTLADVVLEYRITPDRSPIRLALGGAGTAISKTSTPGQWQITGLSGFTGSSGSYELRIASTTAVTDRAGNILSASFPPPVKWQTDVTAPEVVRFGPVTPALRNTAVLSVSLEFSEVVTGVGLSDFTLLRDGDVVPLVGGVDVTGSGKSYSINGLTSLTQADGSYTLRLVASGSGIEDSIGNPLSFDAEVSWTKDATVPTGLFLSVASPVGAGFDAVVLEFSKPVTGLSRDDFTLTRNGAPLDLGLATLSPAGGPAARYVLSGLRNLTGVDGAYEVSVNVGGSTPVRDEVGNQVGAVTPLTWTVDTRVPEATWSGVPAVTRTPVTTASLAFSLPVTGVDESDFLLARVQPDGTIESLSGFTVSGSGNPWTVTLNNLANVDGTYRLRLVAGGSEIVRTGAPANPLRDDATVEWIQDATAPTVVLSQLSWNGDRTFSVRAVFSERVTGLSADNLQVVGGTASNLASIGTSGRDYRFDVTLPAAPANLATVTLPAGMVNDAAGNPNAGSNTLRLSTDFTAPRVTLSGPTVTNASAFQVTATFTEPVTGLDRTDVLITNGTVQSVTGVGTTFTLTVAPTSDGLVTLSLPAGAAEDASGNGSTPSNVLQTRFDSTSPQVTLASLSGAASRAQELRVAVTFDEPVAGLTTGDFAVTNGTISGLIGSSREYVLFVIPDRDGNPDGIDVEIELGAGAAMDAAGNLSRAATPLPLVVRSDRVAPLVALAWIGAGVIEITSSENISGLDLTDFTLTRDGQVVSVRGAALTETSPSEVWELDILNELAAAGPGRYELRLVAARANIVDDVGNSLAIDAAVTVAIDGEAPVATWSGIPPLTRTPLATAAIRFSEPVVGLVPGDIELLRNGIPVVIPPGTITIAPSQGPSTDYEVRGLEPLTAVEGSYELRLVASGTITDEAGNPAASDAVARWTLDATPPQASFGVVAPSPRLPAVFSADIFFSEPVTGFDVGDLQLVRDGVALRLAGARIMPIGTSNTQFRISNLSQLTRLAGDYTLTLRTAGSLVTDAAGNPLAADASVSWTNSGAPVAGPLIAAFQAVTPNPRSSPVDTVAVTFSAVVSGVDAGDFVLERTSGGVTTPLTGFTVAGTGLRRTVEGLLPLTDVPGDYTLRLRAAGSGIASVSGQPLTTDLVAAWTRRPGPAIAPAVTIMVESVARAGAAADAVDVAFNTPVTGVRLASFRLTKGGVPLSLTGAVLSGSGAGYQLRGLAAIAAAPGEYELRLVAAGSGITDAAGQPLAADGVTNWSVTLNEVRATFLAVEPTRTAPLAGVRLRFSVPVLGVDVADLELTRDGVTVPLYGVTVLGRATTWVIGNLSATQTVPGTYALRLRAAGSGIVSSVGSPLAQDALVTWQVG